MKIRHVLTDPQGYVAVYLAAQEPYASYLPISHWCLVRRGDPEQDEIVGMIIGPGVQPADEIAGFQTYIRLAEHTEESLAELVQALMFQAGMLQVQEEEALVGAGVHEPFPDE